jgi:Fic family protein
MSYEPFPDFADWTVEFDPALLERYRRRLEEARRTASAPQVDAAVQVAVRSAAVDTGAIEGLYDSDRGFTRSVATLTAGWEIAADQKGPHVRPAINDQLRAYELVLDAVTGSTIREITQAWIRELHAVLTASQETYRVAVDPGLGAGLRWEDRILGHGNYKTHPNSPTLAHGDTVHAYAPPGDTAAEMERLVDQFRTEAFKDTHPVIQAAYAHHALVWVHPFSDGNGRVARALSSVFLYRGMGVPFVMFADQRVGYYDALEAADGGSRESLVNYFAERVIDTVNSIEEALRGAEGRAEDPVAAIRGKLAPHLAAQRVNLAAERLGRLSEQALRRGLAEIGFPKELRLSFTPLISKRKPLSEFSDAVRAALPPYLSVRSLDVEAGIGNTRARLLVVVSALWSQELVDSAVIPELRLAFDGEQKGSLEVWLRDVEPAATQALLSRLDMWASRAARVLAARVNQAL